MKPYHHEDKVMGLAPWATPFEVQRCRDLLEPLFRVDEERLAPVLDEDLAGLYLTLRERLEGQRFDGIAGSLQQVFVHRLIEWAAQVVAHTKRRTLCFAGGAAMNVRANRALAESGQLDRLFIPLSPAVESTVFGAAYRITEQRFLEESRKPDELPPLNTPYLGPSFEMETIREAAQDLDLVKDQIEIHEIEDDALPARILSAGLTLAVFRGRSEFGQRGLGNRVILGHPSREGMAAKLSRQLRYRDFWMAFGAALLEDEAGDTLDNPSGYPSPFMGMAFPLRKGVENPLREVLHPGDGWIRPQVVDDTMNPAFRDLLERFRSVTGVGALISAPFNLYGEPMVHSPEDAPGHLPPHRAGRRAARKSARHAPSPARRDQKRLILRPHRPEPFRDLRGFPIPRDPAGVLLEEVRT